MKTSNGEVMKVALLLSLIMLTSCASIPEQCDTEYSRYGSMEACIISKTEEKQRRSNALMMMGEGMKNNTRTCNSVPNGFGGFRTTCY